MDNFFILASSSARRKLLLKQMGIHFKSVSPSVIENIYRSPKTTVILNAEQKALDVEKKYPESLILGVDTVVVWKRKILGKPKNFDEAKSMLLNLRNTSHFVYSGLVLIYKKQIIKNWCRTKVYFDKISEADIKKYINLYKPFDKAGGYGIQELAAFFIKKIQGDYYNVVGLPLNLLFNSIEKLHLPFDIFTGCPRSPILLFSTK